MPAAESRARTTEKRAALQQGPPDAASVPVSSVSRDPVHFYSASKAGPPKCGSPNSHFLRGVMRLAISVLRQWPVRKPEGWGEPDLGPGFRVFSTTHTRGLWRTGG